MSVEDILHTADHCDATVARSGGTEETIGLQGVYHVVCTGPDGVEKWRDVAHNTVTTAGKNLVLDSALAGSSYTVTGPYMGLISSTSFSVISASDAMSSHAGWLEAGSAHAPTYTSPRKTCVWSNASGGAKALSAALVFIMTGSGTIKGTFIVTGSGAVSTIDSTAGTLFSAGLFVGGDKPVTSGDTVSCSYSLAA